MRLFVWKIKMFKLLILSISMLLIATTSYAGTVTFSDGTFNMADWDLTITTNQYSADSTVNAYQETSGGNPDQYRRIVDVLTSNGGGYSEVDGFHKRIDAIYNPQTKGAIQSIDYSEDSIMFAGFGQGQATGPALIQNGVIYYGGSYDCNKNPSGCSYGDLLSNQSTWTRQSLNGLTANDFHSIRPDGWPTSDPPDFSTLGSPITFGFFRANSGGFGYTIDAGIDNWSITVNPVSVPSIISLNPVANNSSLWPPNNKMVGVTIQANASDSAGRPVTLTAEISCNEPAKRDQDWTVPVIDQATGLISLSLRATRVGSGTGRIYTITITATGADGNSTTKTVTIVVPHDQGK